MPIIDVSLFLKYFDSEETNNFALIQIQKMEKTFMSSEVSLLELYFSKFIDEIAFNNFLNKTKESLRKIFKDDEMAKVILDFFDDLSKECILMDGKVHLNFEEKEKIHLFKVAFFEDFLVDYMSSLKNS